jgi:hypothetical protein
MHFVKLIQFTRLVKIGGRLREFNFRKLNSKDKESYNVNVCNERGDRFFFIMQKNENNWSIEPDAPGWVRQNENDIGAAIEEEMNSGNWPN